MSKTLLVTGATGKEMPQTIVDVAVKGLYWMLEAARESETFEQFILIGGDASVGHFFYPHPAPVTEAQKHNSKARFLLGWRPVYDMKKMTDAASAYKRAPGDPRVIPYPG